VKYYDVWKDHYGRLKATLALKAIVDDGDAPYGYAYHEIRVAAQNGSDAINKARRAAKEKT
jgi:hypothetical protein